MALQQAIRKEQARGRAGCWVLRDAACVSVKFGLNTGQYLSPKHHSHNHMMYILLEA
jgi:hypothetical protein